jgi:hypothetical protein
MHEPKLLNFTKTVNELLDKTNIFSPIINNNDFEKIYDVNKHIEPNSVINILQSEVTLNKNIINNNEITYNINNNGFRSDNFTNHHDGLHILFAGCSETFGVSSPLEETWAKTVYNEISKNNKISGYFNIGHPSGGIYIIIYQILTYIKKYGSPDFLFVLFPNIDRKVSWINHIGYRQRNGKTIGDPTINNIHAYLTMVYDSMFMYKTLELICQCLNIKLIYGNWDNLDMLHINKISKELTLIDINDTDEFSEYVIKNLSDYESDIFIRRDGVHRGIAFHKFWAHKFLLKFEELMI